MTATASEQDRGKTVVHGTERIGVITDVQGEAVYVDPEWNHVHDELRDRLGWERGDDHHTFEESLVTDIRDGRAHLRDDVL